MKQIFKFSALIFISLFLLSCGKDEDGSSSSSEPIALNLAFTFYAVDSLGNLVFPANGPYLYDHTPDDFSASSEFSENIGLSFNSHSEYGHVFRFGEPVSVVEENEASWQNDSIIEFYPCFGELCDTLFVFNPFNAGDARSAEMLIWNGDTVHNWNSEVLKYEINE